MEKTTVRMKKFYEWLNESASTDIQPEVLERVINFYELTDKSTFPTREELGEKFVQESKQLAKGKTMYRGITGKTAEKIRKALSDNGVYEYSSHGPVTSWSTDEKVARRLAPEGILLKMRPEKLKIIASMDLAFSKAYEMAISEETMEIVQTYDSEKEFISEPITWTFTKNEVDF